MRAQKLDRPVRALREAPPDGVAPERARGVFPKQQRRGPGQRAADTGSASPAALDRAIASELLVRGDDRRARDGQPAGERALRGESLAGPDLAPFDGGADRAGEPPVHRPTRVASFGRPAPERRDEGVRRQTPTPVHFTGMWLLIRRGVRSILLSTWSIHPRWT